MYLNFWIKYMKFLSFPPLFFILFIYLFIFLHYVFIVITAIVITVSLVSYESVTLMGKNGYVHIILEIKP